MNRKVAAGTGLCKAVGKGGTGQAGAYPGGEGIPLDVQGSGNNLPIHDALLVFKGDGTLSKEIDRTDDDKNVHSGIGTVISFLSRLPCVTHLKLTNITNLAAFPCYLSTNSLNALDVIPSILHIIGSMYQLIAQTSFASFVNLVILAKASSDMLYALLQDPTLSFCLIHQAWTPLCILNSQTDRLTVL